MIDLVFYILVFLAIGIFFLFIHLLAGSFFRPSRPEPEKLTIYECGEPTVGSAWIQFDLRYYVVALLFVVFDVEVAFFFPWAVVFGSLTRVAQESYPPTKNDAAIVKTLETPSVPRTSEAPPRRMSPAVAQQWAMLAFADILVFFGVLLVGYAYLWKRGDIDWVRSVTPQPAATAAELPPTAAREEELLALGQSK
jgi:NADH-quinone oxidoreductase subunit A